MNEHILDKLYKVLLSRKNETENASYVASLYIKGGQKIGDKVIEEAKELAVEILALEQTPDNPKVKNDLVNESADLLFHMMIGLAYHDIKPEEVFETLNQRFGTSGHVEKASRAPKSE